jgi:hypothetical protein
MTELEFKNTDPINYGTGNINLLYSSSVSTGSYELPTNVYPNPTYDSSSIDSNGDTLYYYTDAQFPPYRILGLTIPYNSANNVSLEQTLSAITKVKFTIGGTPVSVKVTQISKNAGYFFIRTQPTDTLAFPSETDTSGTPLDSIVEFIFDPYLAAKFNNSDFNALIGNASDNVISDVALQVDRSTDQLTPPNLDAVISKTATRAQIQYSNYTVAGWTNARYEGSKLNSGSIVDEDPAMTLRQFKGSIFPLDASNQTIKTTDDINERVVYFNDSKKPTDYLRIGEPVKTTSTFPLPAVGLSGSFQEYTSNIVTFDTGSGQYVSGSSIVRSYKGDILYEEQGNSFVRIVDKKVLAIDKGTIYTTNELGRIILES